LLMFTRIIVKCYYSFHYTSKWRSCRRWLEYG